MRFRESPRRCRVHGDVEFHSFQMKKSLHSNYTLVKLEAGFSIVIGKLEK